MAEKSNNTNRLFFTLFLVTSCFIRVKCAVFHEHDILLQLNMWRGVNEYINSFSENVTDSDCKNDILTVIDNIAIEEEWALKMFDAWAKPNTGILNGNSMHLGNFDECLSVSYSGNGSDIRGQYCSAFINPKDNKLVNVLVHNLYGIPTNPSGKKSGLLSTLDKLRLSWGICVPTSCTKENLEEIWSFSKTYFNVSLDAEIDDNYCDYQGKHELSNFAYFTVIFLLFCVSIVVVGTIYEVLIYRKEKDDSPNILMEFSAYANSRKILNGKCEDPLCCLNAVRVLSLFWIIVRHYFMLVFYFPHLNGMDLNEWKSQSGNMFILSGSMAVDSFFLASGLSVSYIYLKNQENGEKFNIIKYYSHKLVRVMPTLVLIVLIYASLLTYLGSGPFWPIIYKLFQRDCETKWWSTVTFVANYVHPTGHCLTQGWYLSVDIQLFFLSPLMLLPLSRWPKPTIIGVIILTIGATVQCFIESWTMNLGSTHFDENAAFHTNVIATHIRAPVWLIGFVLGYALFRYKDAPMRLRKSTVIILWLAALAIFFVIILAHQTVASNEYHIVRSTLFNTLVRPSWAIALCWVIFACMKGYGGFANTVLTAPIFNMIIKINFNMFLLHVLPQIYFIGQTRMSTYFNNFHNCYLVLADLAGALILSFVWTLVVEPWIVIMEKTFFHAGAKEPKICTISLLKKDRSEKRNDIEYITVEKDLLRDDSRRESPS